MNVHDGDFAFKESDGGAFHLRLEVPSLECLSFFSWDSSIIIVDGDWSIVQVHVDIIGVERGSQLCSSWVVVDRESIGALEGTWALNRVGKTRFASAV